MLLTPRVFPIAARNNAVRMGAVARAERAEQMQSVLQKEYVKQRVLPNARKRNVVRMAAEVFVVNVTPAKHVMRALVFRVQNLIAKKKSAARMVLVGFVVPVRLVLNVIQMVDVLRRAFRIATERRAGMTDVARVVENVGLGSRVAADGVWRCVSLTATARHAVTTVAVVYAACATLRRYAPAKGFVNRHVNRIAREKFVVTTGVVMRAVPVTARRYARMGNVLSHVFQIAGVPCVATTDVVDNAGCAREMGAAKTGSASACPHAKTRSVVPMVVVDFAEFAPPVIRASDPANAVVRPDRRRVPM